MFLSLLRWSGKPDVPGVVAVRWWVSIILDPEVDLCTQPLIACFQLILDIYLEWEVTIIVSNHWYFGIYLLTEYHLDNPNWYVELAYTFHFIFFYCFPYAWGCSLTEFQVPWLCWYSAVPFLDCLSSSSSFVYLFILLYSVRASFPPRNFFDHLKKVRPTQWVQWRIRCPF